MTKKQEIKTEKIEREYVIPLRAEWRKVPRYKRAAKAIKAIKEFLARHMKIYDRDLNKIKIDGYLNEFVWFRGIKKPPAKIKVKVIKEDDIVKVELAELPDKLKFKKIREEKRETKAKESVEKKKTFMQKLKEPGEKKPETEAQKEEDKKIESEKKTAVVEEGQKFEKAKAKEIKHQEGGKIKQPKRQKRVALAK
ncbi:MAG: 50S ribosomal protein L31e [Nanoarchaeota archaeon]|nr:50S ribosomal protein L31e [Nanoarchaeota archaeon]